MDPLLFSVAIACLVALLSALAIVMLRRPVYSVVGLLAHSLSLAGLFAILGAGMVAVGQIVIYSGAIVVLFLFVVTLLPTGGKELAPSSGRVLLGLAASVVLLVALAATIAGIAPLTGSVSGAGDIRAIGHALFGPLLVAFELTAPLLLVAIIAAVSIWRRHEPQRTVARTQLPATPRKVVVHR